MIELEHSMRAADDSTFYRIQQISQYNMKKIQDNSELIDEFRQLYSDNLKFIEDWNDLSIPPSTIRLYSKKVLVREVEK